MHTTTQVNSSYLLSNVSASCEQTRCCSSQKLELSSFRNTCAPNIPPCTREHNYQWSCHRCRQIDRRSPGPDSAEVRRIPVGLLWSGYLRCGRTLSVGWRSPCNREVFCNGHERRLKWFKWFLLICRILKQGKIRKVEKMAWGKKEKFWQKYLPVK